MDTPVDAGRAVGNGRPGVRRGVVLGAGGTLGAAWMIARLRALEVTRGFDTREVELVIGSSAGSVLAAMITGGISVQRLLDHQRGEADATNPLAMSGFDYDSSVGGALPERPPLRVGSTKLLRQYARHPAKVGALTGLAAALPPGRGSLANLRAAVNAATVETAGAWPERPELKIVALDYETGERVVFSSPAHRVEVHAPGAVPGPHATVVDAVIASCSIPGWFAPTIIAGHPYIDAGFRQATSADLAAGAGLDELIVLSPLASYLTEPHRSGRFSRLERRWRAHLTKILDDEVAALKFEPCAVTVLTPSRAERIAMGANLMDHTRRVPVLEAALAAAATENAIAAARIPAAGQE